jgi:hypothetical protein
VNPPTDFGLAEIPGLHYPYIPAANASGAASAQETNGSAMPASGDRAGAPNKGNGSETPSDATTGREYWRTMYQVSVTMNCTGEQLQSVMGGLAGLGTNSSMKIQINSTDSQ